MSSRTIRLGEALQRSCTTLPSCSLYSFSYRALIIALTEVIIDIIRNILGRHIKGSKRTLHTTDETLTSYPCYCRYPLWSIRKFPISLSRSASCGTGNCVILLPKSLHLLPSYYASLVFIGLGKGIVPRLKVLVNLLPTIVVSTARCIYPLKLSESLSWNCPHIHEGYPQRNCRKRYRTLSVSCSLIWF